MKTSENLIIFLYGSWNLTKANIFVCIGKTLKNLIFLGIWMENAGSLMTRLRAGGIRRFRSP